MLVSGEQAQTNDDATLARNSEEIQITDDAVVNSKEVEIVDVSIRNSDEIQQVEEPKETEPTQFQMVKNIIVKKARYETTPVACGKRGEYNKYWRS